MGNIYGSGIDQSDLYTLLNAMITNFNAVLAKLDADAGVGVTDSDYVSLWAMTAMSSRSGQPSANGLCQRDIVEILDTFITNFNAVLTKLDADTLVTDTNYSSLWAITDVVNSVVAGRISNNGLDQSNLVNLLNTIITNIAGLNAKLDADVTATDYASTCDISDTVDTVGCTD